MGNGTFVRVNNVSKRLYIAVQETSSRVCSFVDGTSHIRIKAKPKGIALNDK
jgi:hypothetical protein